MNHNGTVPDLAKRKGNSMDGYKGKVVFFKDTKYNTIHVFHGEMIDYMMKKKDGVDVYLGECEVDVTFCDVRQAEVEALKKQIETVRAESQHRINVMLGRIQELQAIAHDGGDK